jgi:hypothetical protein
MQKKGHKGPKKLILVAEVVTDKVRKTDQAPKRPKVKTKLD